VQGHNPFQLVHIYTAHYWQHFDLVRSHALERQIKPLIGVDVGKGERIQDFADLLISTLADLPLQSGKIDNSNGPSSISHNPSSGFIAASQCQSLPNRCLRRQRKVRWAHHSDYFPPNLLLARRRRRQVDAILYCKGFI
jgi:hypothetical protein